MDPLRSPLTPQEIADRMIAYLWRTASVEARMEYGRLVADALASGVFPRQSEIERVAELLCR